MKTMQQLFSDNSRETVEKINKAAVKSNSEQYLAGFRSEVERASAKDFPKVGILVTDSYICSYTKIAFSLNFTLTPIADVLRLYRSNIWNNSYNFETWYLCADIQNGPEQEAKLLLSNQLRRGIKNIGIYDEVIAFINTKKAALA